MARRPLTKELYDRLVASFREAPGNYSHAAKSAGCERRMAKRGWEAGWLTQFAWARPIEEVIAAEQEAGRARAQAEAERIRQEREAEGARAREHAAEGRKLMAQILDMERAALLRSGAVASHLTVTAVKLAEQARLDIEKDIEKGMVAPGAALSMLNRIVHLVERLVRATHELLSTEKLELGQPGAIIGVQVSAIPEEITLDEAEKRLEAAAQALASSRRGHLLVIEGGLGGEAASKRSWDGGEPDAAGEEPERVEEDEAAGV